jgi:hypothetical protein
MAAYGAAAAMLPYLIVKIGWTVDGLSGGGLRDGAWSLLDWGAVNGLTVVMAGLAILLGLALAQPWGMRVPAWLLLTPGWLASGFLVSMIPVLPAIFVLSTPDADAVGAASSFEPLVGLSFAGFALGLAIAVPGYARARWPHAFRGRVVDGGESPAAVRDLRRTAGALVAVACTALGLVQAFWAVGGTLGLDPATLDARDASWHVLTANSAAWAWVAAAGGWVLGRGSSRAPLGLTVLLTWVASGSLFAWGSWKQAFLFAAAALPPAPEPLAVRVLLNHVGALAGLLLLVVLLLALSTCPPAPSSRTALVSAQEQQ